MDSQAGARRTPEPHSRRTELIWHAERQTPLFRRIFILVAGFVNPLETVFFRNYCVAWHFEAAIVA
jgi:hypothetical protein